MPCWNTEFFLVLQMIKSAPHLAFSAQELLGHRVAGEGHRRGPQHKRGALWHCLPNCSPRSRGGDCQSSDSSQLTEAGGPRH